MTSVRMLQVFCALLLWISNTSAARLSLSGRHHGGRHNEYLEKNQDPDDEDFNPMCDDPNDETYNPDDPKCTGGPPFIPMCDDPDDPQYNPDDPECAEWNDDMDMGGDHGSEGSEYYYAMGNGEDNMAEEMADVDNGPNFDDFDTNGDGQITQNEAATYGVANGIPAGEVQDIFDYVDKDGDGYITRAEFDSDGSQEVTEDMAPTFSDLDFNADEVIEWEEFQYACVCGLSYLDTCASEAMCKDLFDAGDADQSGGLTKAEFDAAGAACESADDGNCDFLASKKASRAPGQITIRSLFKVKKSPHTLWTLLRQRFRKFKKANRQIKQKLPSEGGEIVFSETVFPKKVQKKKTSKQHPHKHLIMSHSRVAMKNGHRHKKRRPRLEAITRSRVHY